MTLLRLSEWRHQSSVSFAHFTHFSNLNADISNQFTAFLIMKSFVKFWGTICLSILQRATNLSPSPERKLIYGCEDTNKGAIFEDECKQMIFKQPLATLRDFVKEWSGSIQSKMSRKEFFSPRVPEVHDESIATTLKVIMDVLKVSRLISLLCLCCFVASNSIINTPFENVVT